MSQISLLENTRSMHYIITFIREVSHGVMVSTAAHLWKLPETVILVHGCVKSYSKSIAIQYNVFENTLANTVTVSTLKCLLLCLQN